MPARPFQMDPADWALGPRGRSTVVSYIARDNARSIAVARRLGAAVDAAAATPGGNDCLVFRYNRAVAA